MAQQVFRIGNTDFSSFVKSGGLRWSRNDIDAPGSGRDMTGTMRRGRVAIKVKLQISCRNLTHDQMLALNAALSPETVTVAYLDPREGLRVSTFYGSSVDAATWTSHNNETIWEGASFNLVEV